MYVEYINIDVTKCDSTKCNQECVADGPEIFQIDPKTHKAIVIITQPLTDPNDEVKAGYAIQHCPKSAIWGRGQGEVLDQGHHLGQ